MDQVPLPPQKSASKSFLAQLQSLEEPIKRRILVGATAVVMVVVVYIWVGYFNSIVLNNPVELANQSAVAGAGTGGAATGTIAIQPGAAQTPAAQGSPAANTPSFWSQLGSGFVSLYNDMAGGVKNIGGSLQAPKDYNITPGTGQ